MDQEFHTYQLQPFSDKNPQWIQSISGKISRQDNRFILSCDISGDVSYVIVPEAATIPERRNSLWENTCLEFFISVKENPAYREFNLSPAGHWNVYQFDDYRKGMKLDKSFNNLPYIFKRQFGKLSLFLKLDPVKICRPDQVLEVGICAVIEYKDSTKQYWALVHPGLSPDFHKRDSFILNL
jgi:hypothetical protein